MGGYTNSDMADDVDEQSNSNDEKNKATSYRNISDIYIYSTCLFALTTLAPISFDEVAKNSDSIIAMLEKMNTIKKNIT